MAETQDWFSANAPTAPPAVPHNEARMGATIPGTAFAGAANDPETNGVTFQDLVERPTESIVRIGQQLKADLSDPKTWLQAGLMYFGPKVFNKAAPVIARAAAATAAPAPAAPAPAQPGMISRVAGVLEPNDVGIIPGGSNLRQALNLAQRIKGAVNGPSAPVEAPAAAAPPPAVESPAPTPPPSASPAASGESPVAAPTMSPQRIQNELGLAARRAGLKLSEPQYQQAATLVTQGQSPIEAVQAVAAPAAPVKSKLSGAEFQVAQSLMNQGMAPDQALQTVLGQRAFAERFGLPSNQDVQTVVSAKNARTTVAKGGTKR